MLQQTTTTAVKPYFTQFLEKWPTLESFSRAHLDEILNCWQGLGYYSRARHMHQCAQILMSTYKGKFPTNVDELLKLPGIGPYTAAAIVTIAFDQPAIAIDGNIIRVFSRLHALPDPMPKHKSKIEKIASGYLPGKRFGDYTQALMDLGAMVCTPKNPPCGLCPWKSACQAFKTGTMDAYPVKETKKSLPEKFTVAFVIENAQGHILLRKRPPQGLLGGLYELPNLPWIDHPYEWDQLINQAPLQEQWVCEEQMIKHTFTHFHLYVKILHTRTQTPPEGLWCSPESLQAFALPTLFKKVLKTSSRLSSFLIR